MSVNVFDFIREAYLGMHDLARTPEERLAYGVEVLGRLGEKLKAARDDEPEDRLEALARDLDRARYKAAAEVIAEAREREERTSPAIVGLVQDSITIRFDREAGCWEASIGPEGDRLFCTGLTVGEAIAGIAEHLDGSRRSSHRHPENGRPVPVEPMPPGNRCGRATSDYEALQGDLCRLLNRHSAEGHSDTPDFILAGYLIDCLQNWNFTLRRRKEWWGGRDGGDACGGDQDPLREALEGVLIGGNHLANIIGADHPPYTASCDDALRHYGSGDRYEAWCCWATIMKARDMVDALVSVAPRSTFGRTFMVARD